jgi:hypothetical protein
LGQALTRPIFEQSDANAISQNEFH